MNKNGVSVVLCCYNSEKRLPQTLLHLAKQDFSLNLEIIIINNNSQDSTSKVAILEWEKLNGKFPLRIIDENEPGLSAARHRGVKEAQFNYVLFCDDDNWLAPDYVSTAAATLDSDKNIAAVGGQSTITTDGNVPEWFDEYKEGYAVGKQARNSGDVSYRKYLWGAGLTFRKNLFIQAFLEHPSLLSDRKGNTLTSGGDSEICMRFLLLGYKLYYDEALKFKHFIPASRLVKSYCSNLYESFKTSQHFLNEYSILIDSMNLRNTNSIVSITSKTLIKSFSLKEQKDRERAKKIFFFLTGFSLGSITEQTHIVRSIGISLRKSKNMSPSHIGIQ